MRKLEIRVSTAAEITGILDVVMRAFGDESGPEVADLVKKLFIDTTARPFLSLVAVNDHQAVGHILFTKAEIINSKESPVVVILAPLAVIPEAQSQGVGGRLIEEGLRRLSKSGVELVFVLGHPEYYPRHGFKPAGILGFEAPFPIPEAKANAWMVQELRPGLIGSIRGRITCADVMNQPEHWRE